MKIHNKNLGASMLEALAFLLISGIIIISVVWLINASSNRAKADLYLKDFISVQAGLVGYQKIFDGNYHDMADYLIAVNSVPSNIQHDKISDPQPRRMYNAWGGPLTMEMLSRHLYITDESVPLESCAKEVTGIKGFSVYLVLGGNSYVSKNGESMPMSIALSECTDNSYDPGDGTQVVDLYFQKN